MKKFAMVVNEVGALSLGTAICIPIPQTPPRVCPTGSGYSSPDSLASPSSLSFQSLSSCA